MLARGRLLQVTAEMEWVEAQPDFAAAEEIGRGPGSANHQLQVDRSRSACAGRTLQVHRLVIGQVSAFFTQH